MELIVQRIEGKQGITQNQLQAILDSFPYDDLDLRIVPFAAVGQSENGDQFSVFGFMREDVSRSKINEEMIDGFNASLLREAEKKIPVGARKTVNPYGISTIIIG